MCNAQSFLRLLCHFAQRSCRSTRRGSLQVAQWQCACAIRRECGSETRPQAFTRCVGCTNDCCCTRCIVQCARPQTQLRRREYVAPFVKSSSASSLRSSRSICTRAPYGFHFGRRCCGVSGLGRARCPDCGSVLAASSRSCSWCHSILLSGTPVLPECALWGSGGSGGGSGSRGRGADRGRPVRGLQRRRSWMEVAAARLARVTKNIVGRGCGEFPMNQSFANCFCGLRRRFSFEHAIVFARGFPGTVGWHIAASDTRRGQRQC